MGVVGRVVLAIVGAVVGYVIGGPTGAVYGASIGLGVGSILFAPDVSHPGPQQLQVNMSQYASAIPVVRGKRKIAGNLLAYWGFRAVETDAGGKGGKGGSGYYEYYVNLAWGLCIGGPDTQLVNIWKGKDRVTESLLATLPDGGYVFYDGTQTSPDPYIAAHAGFERKPVWKGLAYVVMPNFPLGSSAYIPNFTFEVACGGDDVAPSDLSAEILTDTFWGLGLPSSLLDSDVYADTAAYCQANGLLISMIMDRQMSVLDQLQQVLAHHNGYITYGGRIGHHQMKAEQSRGTIYEGHLSKDGDDYPITMAKNMGKSQHNKITVQYTKRDKEYVQGTASADDLLDIDQSGLRDATVKLDGITSHDLASKMANLLLFKDRNQPRTFSFRLGPDMIGVQPGQVFSLTVPSLEVYDVKVRIGPVSETENYEIEVTAQEEFDEAYDYVVSGADVSAPEGPPNFMDPPGHVVNPVVVEIPAKYSSAPMLAIGYSRGSGDAWAGAAVYRSYAAGGSYYPLAEPKPGTGITGRVIAVTATTIDVELDWDATLSPAGNMVELITEPTKNIFALKTAAGDRFCKFQDADLIGVRQWRLSRVIFDVAGVPRFGYGISGVAVNDLFVVYAGARVISVDEADTFRTLYFKLPSFNYGGYFEDIADCTEISEYVDGIGSVPLPPCTIKVNGIGLQDDLLVRPGVGDLVVEWRGRNRYCNGQYVYDRADTIYDDPDFVQYRVEIYQGSTLTRIVSQTGKTFTYSTAMQSADGTTTGNLSMVIRQINTSRTSDAATITIVR